MLRMVKVLERIHASITPERTQKIINGKLIFKWKLIKRDYFYVSSKETTWQWFPVRVYHPKYIKILDLQWILSLVLVGNVCYGGGGGT